MRGSSPRAGRKVLEYPFPALTEMPSARGLTNRMWVLVLDCGHTVLRPVEYIGIGRRGGGRNRELADYLPHPRRAACEHCPSPG